MKNHVKFVCAINLAALITLGSFVSASAQGGGGGGGGGGAGGGAAGGAAGGASGAGVAASGVAASGGVVGTPQLTGGVSTNASPFNGTAFNNVNGLGTARLSDGRSLGQAMQQAGNLNTNLADISLQNGTTLADAVAQLGVSTNPQTLGDLAALVNQGNISGLNGLGGLFGNSEFASLGGASYGSMGGGLGGGMMGMMGQKGRSAEGVMHVTQATRRVGGGIAVPIAVGTKKIMRDGIVQTVSAPIVSEYHWPTQVAWSQSSTSFGRTYKTSRRIASKRVRGKKQCVCVHGKRGKLTASRRYSKTL